MSWFRRDAADDADEGAASADRSASGGVAAQQDGGEELEPPVDVSLGELLREARIQRALTLADVERDTRINRDYLEALEHEHYDVLPAPVYARGFLRSYARHLELDVEEVSSLLPAELPQPPGLEPLPGLRRGSRPALPAVDWPLAAVVIGAGAIVLVLIFAASRLGGGSEADAPPPAPPAATASPAASPGVSPAATVPPFAVGETPNFVGVDRDTAQALLTQLGQRFVVIEIATSAAPRGLVFAQAPEPGSAIEAGGDVTLIVSGGPPK